MCLDFSLVMNVLGIIVSTFSVSIEKRHSLFFHLYTVSSKINFLVFIVDFLYTLYLLMSWLGSFLLVFINKYLYPKLCEPIISFSRVPIQFWCYGINNLIKRMWHFSCYFFSSLCNVFSPAFFSEKNYLSAGRFSCEDFEFHVGSLNDHRSLLLFFAHHVSFEEQKCLIDEIVKFFNLFLLLVMLFWSYVKKSFF